MRNFVMFTFHTDLRNSKFFKKATQNFVVKLLSDPAKICHRSVCAHLDLSFHGDTEKSDEVHDQNGPEYGDVEEFKKGATESDNGGFGRRIPKFELGESSYERSKLVTLLGRKLEAIFAFFSLQIGQSGVNFGRQKGQQ